jgi:phospholipid/cholesterol/gamma-HCH transport system ATP-binding protein
MARLAPIISVRGVVNRFGSQVVHDGVDLDVFPGEVLGIVGGSGSGKSVLLRTMLGLHRPAAGEVLVEGKDLMRLSEAELLAVKQRYGVTFQHGALFSSLTVAENIQFPILEYFDASPQALEAMTQLRLRMVGLPPDAGAKLPSQLSGGMIKRAALARALALDPEIVFLDEPTSGLDPIGAAEFDELVAKLRDTMGLTVYMVTHDLDSLFSVCDRIAVLGNKKVLVEGTIEEMLKSEESWVKSYFRGKRARQLDLSARA